MFIVTNLYHWEYRSFKK